MFSCACSRVFGCLPGDLTVHLTSLRESFSRPDYDGCCGVLAHFHFKGLVVGHRRSLQLNSTCLNYTHGVSSQRVIPHPTFCLKSLPYLLLRLPRCIGKSFFHAIPLPSPSAHFYTTQGKTVSVPHHVVAVAHSSSLRPSASCLEIALNLSSLQFSAAVTRRHLRLLACSRRCDGGHRDRRHTRLRSPLFRQQHG